MTGLLNPLLRPVLGPLLRQTIGGSVGGLQPSAFSSAKYAIKQNASDVQILVIGDSTGNDVSEWVYLFAGWLASAYPSHSVSYRLWDDTSNVYSAAVAISTGTGSNTIRIWNVSVAGTQARYLMGDKFNASIDSISADLVIWNYGKNQVTGSTLPIAQGETEAALDQVSLAKPGVPFAAFIQNPNRDDDLMALADTVWSNIGNLRKDIRILDVYTKFIAAGKPPSWYVDNVHPSPIGSAVWVGVLEDAWLASMTNNTFTVLPAWMNSSAKDYLFGDSGERYGDFSIANSGAVPAGFIATGTITFSDDTANPYNGSPRCMKTLVVSGSAPHITRQLTATNLASLKGKNCTLLAIQKIDNGAAGTVGRFGMTIGGTGGGSYSTISSVAFGGWTIQAIGPIFVPQTATFIQATFYMDSAASPDTTHASYWQRVMLVEGDVPREMP